MISNDNENEEMLTADDDDDNKDDEASRPHQHAHSIGAPLSFPLQMMEILSDEDNVDIVRWLPHGKGFIVPDKKRFAAEIMPKFFSRSSKYTSFTRKLNRWNFTRVTRGPETGAYYHPQFQRGNTKMCQEMSCLAAKVPQHNDAMNPVALGVRSGEAATAASTIASAAANPGSCSLQGLEGGGGEVAAGSVAATPQAVVQLQLQQQAIAMTMAAMMQQQPTTGTVETATDNEAVVGSQQPDGAATAPGGAQWSAAQQQQFFNLYMQSQQQYLMQNQRRLNAMTTAPSTSSVNLQQQLEVGIDKEDDYREGVDDVPGCE